MSIFKSIGAWFSKIFKSVQQDGDKIAIAITEDVQEALKSGVVDALAGVISSEFPSVKNLPQEVVTLLRQVIPELLAAELAIQGLPTNPTQVDIQAFITRVLDAFKVDNNNSKLWTLLASQIYGLLQNYINAPKQTFAELVAIVEQAYQDYIQDQNASS